MLESTNFYIFLSAFAALFLCIWTVFSLGHVTSSLVYKYFSFDFFLKRPFLRFVISYLIGLRVFNLLIFVAAQCGLGFRITVSCIAGFSVLLFLYYFYHYRNFKLNQFLTKQTLFLCFVFLLTIFLMLAATYHPNFIWDHLTYWLLVPREILVHDMAVGFYDYTRSVAIDYPAHQVHLGAMLLYFWDENHLSDTVTHMFAPFHLLLTFFVIYEFFRSQSKSLIVLILFAVLFYFISASHGGGYLYVTAFYGELFAALSVVVLLVGITFWSQEKSKSRNILPLSLILTMPIIAKPYILPIICLGLLYVFFQSPLKTWLKTLCLSFVLFLVEAFPVYWVQKIAKVSEKVDRLDAYNNLALFSITRLNTFEDALDRFFMLFTFHPGTSDYLALVYLLCITMGLFTIVFYKYKRKESLKNQENLQLSILSIGALLLIVLEISFIAVFLSAAAASSAPRYFSNFIFVCLLLALTFLLTFSSVFKKVLVRNTFLCIGLIVFIVAIQPKSIFINWLHGGYNRLTLSNYSIFPASREIRYRTKILDELKNYRRGDKKILFYHHSLSSSSINRKWYYLLARSNPKLRIIDYYQSDKYEYFKIRRRIHKGKIRRKDLSKHNIGLVLVLQRSFFGEKELFGLYTTKKFLEVAVKTPLDVEKSTGSKAL